MILRHDHLDRIPKRLLCQTLTNYNLTAADSLLQLSLSQMEYDTVKPIKCILPSDQTIDVQFISFHVEISTPSFPSVVDLTGHKIRGEERRRLNTGQILCGS